MRLHILELNFKYANLKSHFFIHKKNIPITIICYFKSCTVYELHVQKSRALNYIPYKKTFQQLILMISHDLNFF